MRQCQMSETIPIRLSADGTVATWNPAATRAVQLGVRVRRPDGSVEERRTVNSGRVRVRPGERIEQVFTADSPGEGQAQQDP